ncbi:hypothetical protein CJU89_5661 [Yarrowia sp. B02]|nr:hypothetical protein CJU89_5661 [Yarrowia sp. B02]
MTLRSLETSIVLEFPNLKADYKRDLASLVPEFTRPFQGKQIQLFLNLSMIVDESDPRWLWEPRYKLQRRLDNYYAANKTLCAEYDNFKCLCKEKHPKELSDDLKQAQIFANASNDDFLVQEQIHKLLKGQSVESKQYVLLENNSFSRHLRIEKTRPVLKKKRLGLEDKFHLPVEVAAKIFSYCDIEESRKVSQVPEGFVPLIEPEPETVSETPTVTETEEEFEFLVSYRGLQFLAPDFTHRTPEQFCNDLSISVHKDLVVLRNYEDSFLLDRENGLDYEQGIPYDGADSLSFQIARVLVLKGAIGNRCHYFLSRGKFLPLACDEAVPVACYNGLILWFHETSIVPGFVDPWNKNGFPQQYRKILFVWLRNRWSRLNRVFDF